MAKPGRNPDPLPEFKVLVDGNVVAKKRFLIFKPSVEKVVQAVRETI